MTALSILVVGLLLGMQHATEADHLAALATLATRQRSLAQTLRQGVAWGVGHALTLMAFGGAVLLAGAEPEELGTAVVAAARDRPGLAAGDALGANLTMLPAALGLAALARPLPVGRRTRQYAVASAVASPVVVTSCVCMWRRG